ncbi:MAG: metallophosphoesterase [Saccharofermentans sp.]|nr:metallophosphoesterase [Saccharofermentans sp.]
MEKIYPFLIALAALIVLYLLWCLAEPFFLESDRAVLKKSNKINNNDINIKKLPLIPEAAADNPDFRFFFFSDIHAEWCPVTAKRVCKSIRRMHQEAPLDAVIFGGDLISGSSRAAKGYRYLQEVSACCKELGIPYYGVTGNHDARIEDTSLSTGFISLDGEVIPLVSPRTGRAASLAGIPDSGTRKLEWPPMPHCDANNPVILVVHDPDALIHIEPEQRPDFMLAGHLHGGQMKFPFRIEFHILRSKDQLPKKGVVQGVYDIDGTVVFISRGLGCGVLPFRFLSVPEVSVVEICL